MKSPNAMQHMKELQDQKETERREDKEQQREREDRLVRDGSHFVTYHHRILPGFNTWNDKVSSLKKDCLIVFI